MSSARSRLQQNEERASVVHSGTPSRPAYDIKKEQLEMLLRARFSVRSIADLLHVSSRTIERRMECLNE